MIGFLIGVVLTIAAYRYIKPFRSFMTKTVNPDPKPPGKTVNPDPEPPKK